MAITVTIETQTTFTVTITGHANDSLFSGSHDDLPDRVLQRLIARGLGVDPDEVDPPLSDGDIPF